jgi:hypothetical protein
MRSHLLICLAFAAIAPATAFAQAASTIPPVPASNGESVKLAYVMVFVSDM